MSDSLATPAERITVYAMNFAPELIGSGRYTGQLVAFLATAGHPVDVVTTVPHYPGWFAREPYSAGRYYRESEGNVRVWRCPQRMDGKHSGIRRLISPLSFALSSAPVAFWRILRGRPRAVVVIEPTIAVAPVALLAAWLVGARTVLHVQDLEVDAAIAVGHIRLPPLATRAAFAIERWLLRRFSAVVTISMRMADRLVEKGVPRERVSLVRNWVDADHIYPLARSAEYRAELGFDDEAFVVLYSGQIGKKQWLHILLEAAEALRDHPRIKFVVAGEGPLKASLQEQYGALPNLHFLPLQPENRLNEFLGFADLHVLPQDPAVADLVLPSKLGGMLASGKPIIATADPQSELGQFVAGAATLVEPHGLAQAIVAAADDPAPFPNEAGLKRAREISAQTMLPAFREVLVRA